MISSFALRTRGHLSALCALVLSSLLLASLASAQERPAVGDAKPAPIVLELFTSLICGNCPKADGLAVELHERDDVLVLSYHIDYLNMGPVKDPLSHRDWTNRQRWYRELHQSAYVYTPQIVIDGQHTVVGSDRAAVMAAMEQARDGHTHLVFEPASNGKLRLKLEQQSAGRLDLLELHFSKLTRASLSKRGNKVVERLYANSVMQVERRAVPEDTPELLLSWSEQDFKAQGRAFVLQDRHNGKIVGAYWGYRE